MKLIVGNPHGAVIKAYPMPTKKRGRPSTTMVLTVSGSPFPLKPGNVDTIKRYYENRFHKVLGVWWNPSTGDTELTLSYEGTRGHGRDQHAITKRLKDHVLPLLPTDHTYELRYWNDPERLKS